MNNTNLHIFVININILKHVNFYNEPSKRCYRFFKNLKQIIMIIVIIN